MDKSRREYRAGVKDLKEWLDNAETLIYSPLNCNLQELRSRVKALDVSNSLGLRSLHNATASQFSRNGMRDDGEGLMDVDATGFHL